MGLMLVKFLGGTYPLTESVKIFLDELARAEVDDVTKEEILKNPFAMSEKMPSLLVSLSQDPKFNLADMRKYDMRMSENILARLTKAADKKSVLMQAYVFCPFCLEVYLSCVRCGLLDFDTYKTAEYFGFSERILDEIVTVVSENYEDKDLTAGLVSVYAQAKDVPEERVWASFRKEEEPEKEKVAVRKQAEAKKEKAEARKKKVEARKKKAEEKAEARKEKAEAKKEKAEAKKEKVEAKKEKAEARKEKAETKKGKAEAREEKAETKKGKAEARETQLKKAATEKPELNKKSSKKRMVYLAGAALLCLILLLWKLNSSPENNESADMATTPAIEDTFESQSPDETAQEFLDQKTAEETAASLSDRILTELDVENVYEYNEKTKLYDFEKTVKNTTDLTLENVTLEVTLGSDVNTYTREVWYPDEEWKLVVSASEDTLVDDDFVFEAELTHYTYQSYTK